MNLDKFIIKIAQMGSLINDYADKKHYTYRLILGSVTNFILRYDACEN